MSPWLCPSWIRLHFGTILGTVWYIHINFICMFAVFVVNIYLLSPCSEFQDIFDVEHFITSLRDEVRILRELPPRVKRRVELGMFHSMPPVSWSDISYYHNQVSIISHCVKAALCCRRIY
jgi:hypothetical protein